MSRMWDEKREERKGARKKPEDSGKPKPNIAFHPTKAQREQINGAYLDMDKSLEAIEAITKNRVKVTLGRAESTNAAYLILRDANVDWQDAVTVSFFHVDLVKCIAQAAYYLSEIAPDFPQGQTLGFDGADDW